MMKEINSSEGTVDYLLDPYVGITGWNVQDVIWDLQDGLNVTVIVLGRYPWKGTYRTYEKRLDK
jgi:hypothetical protein